jgi:hypothetical protein
VAWVKRQLPNLDPKDLLPLGIEVIQGAIICGNSSTPNLLVAEFQRTEGTFGILKVCDKTKSVLYFVEHLSGIRIVPVQIGSLQTNSWVEIPECRYTVCAK